MGDRPACDVAFPLRDSILAVQTFLEGRLKPREPIVVDARETQEVRSQGSLRVDAAHRWLDAYGLGLLLHHLEDAGLQRGVGLPVNVHERLRALADATLDAVSGDAQDLTQALGGAVHILKSGRVHVDRYGWPIYRQLAAQAVSDRPSARG